MRGFKPYHLALGSAADSVSQSLLLLGAMGPPRRLPKWFPNHFVFGDASKCQGGAVGFDNCSICCHETDELKRLIEDGPKPQVAGLHSSDCLFRHSGSLKGVLA